MKKLNVFILLLVASLFLYSCSKDNNNDTVPARDYSQQYQADLDTINKFIDTHHMDVDADYNVTFSRIPTGGSQQTIRQQYTLESVQVRNLDDDGEDFEYKVFYIKLNEGGGNYPTRVDSIYTAYTGDRIYYKQEEILPATDPKTYNYYNDNIQFETSPFPVWFKLDEVIQGWAEIFPHFRTGLYDTNEDPNPVNFSNYGAGVMFVPSGLAYYSNSSGNIPSYSNLIFSFKLYELRYRDHDRDGILSKDEVATLTDKPETTYNDYYDYENFFKYDTDADDKPNMFDIDDDGDRIMTKIEIIQSTDPITGAETLYPFADIPTCGSSGNGKKKHLDPSCQ